MRNLFFLLLALSMLVGCAVPASSVQIVVAQSAKARNTNPTSSTSELTRLVSNNTTFAFDLYRLLKAKQGNLFLSPYSISTALAMAQSGARGETLTQINHALRFTLPADSLHSAFNALQLSLNKREQNDQDPKIKDFTLRVINALWGEKSYTFKAEYLDLLAENYGAGMCLVDFAGAPEPSRQVINQWISEQTEQRIKDLFPPDSFDIYTTMVIANAIYFNAEWAMPFYSGKTSPGDFTLLDGKIVQAPMMVTENRFNYYQGNLYQTVELPYKGEKLSMVVVVPDAGKFAEVESAFSADELEKLKKQSIQPEVKLQMPKFTFESSFNLTSALESLGMKDAFDEKKANFSGMDGSRNLYISQVEHKTFIAVNEVGTEAAAATGMQFKNVSMPLRTVELKIDRPFMFLILDKQSGSVLFFGRFTNPQ